MVLKNGMPSLNELTLDFNKYINEHYEELEERFLKERFSGSLQPYSICRRHIFAAVPEGLCHLRDMSSSRLCYLLDYVLL